MDGRLLDIVDKEWRTDKLPEEDIAVPIAELPDPEADNGASGESMREQENKWTDLALNQVGDGAADGANNADTRQ